VAPAVVADQAGGFVERYDARVGHPVEVRQLAAQLTDIVPDAGDRPAVEVVVAEHEIDRATSREGPQVVYHVVGLPHVAGDGEGIGVRQRGKERVQAGTAQEVQVNVGEPGEAFHESGSFGGSCGR